MEGHALNGAAQRLPRRPKGSCLISARDTGQAGFESGLRTADLEDIDFSRKRRFGEISDMQTPCTTTPRISGGNMITVLKRLAPRHGAKI